MDFRKEIQQRAEDMGIDMVCLDHLYTIAEHYVAGDDERADQMKSSFLRDNSKIKPSDVETIIEIIRNHTVRIGTTSFDVTPTGIQRRYV